MNKHSNILVVSLLLILIAMGTVACDGEDSHIYSGPNYVEFPLSNTSTELEYNFVGTESIEIKTQIIGAQEESDKQISFEVVEEASSAVSGVNYTLVTDGSFVISQNNSFGYIELDFIGSSIGPGESVEMELSLLDDGDLLPNPNYAIATHTISKASRPVIGFAESEMVINESETGTISATISLDKPAVTDVAVEYAIGGTAVEGVDYDFEDLPSNPFIITAGETSAEIKFVLTDDLEVETDQLEIELMGVNPSTDDDNDDITLGNALITIEIDDEINSVSMVQNELALSEQNVGVNIFSVNMEEVSTEVITVNYSVTGGASGVDYNDLTGGSLVFEPGQISKNIDFQLLQDAFGGVDFDITIELTGLTSADGELKLSEDSQSLVLTVVN